MVFFLFFLICGEGGCCAYEVGLKWITLAVSLGDWYMVNDDVTWIFYGFLNHGKLYAIHEVYIYCCVCGAKASNLTCLSVFDHYTMF